MKASAHLTILALVSLYSFGLWAETLLVEKGSPLVINDLTTYDKSYTELRQRDDLTIARGGKLSLSGSGGRKYFYIGYDTGDDVTFTIENTESTPGAKDGGKLTANTPNNVYFTYGRGGARGRVVVNGEWPIENVHDVQAAALPGSSGFVDFWTITGYTYLNSVIVRSTTVPARIIFASPSAMIGPSSRSDHMQLRPVIGAELHLVGDENNPIGLTCNYWSKGFDFNLARMDGEGGKTVLTGACDVVVYSSNSSRWMNTDGHPCAILANADSSQLIWAQSGDFRLTDLSVVRLTADNSLPVGPQTGKIVMESSKSNDAPWLDLNGHTAAINGLEATHEKAIVTNTAAESATLRLGTWNENSPFCARTVSARIVVRKEGTGTLALTDTVMPRLEVAGGVVYVTGDGVRIESLSIAGAEVLVDGGKLVCGSASTTAGGRIRCVNGGTVVGAGEADVRVELPSGGNAFACSSSSDGNVSIVKCGANETTLLGGGSFAAVDVTAGTLRIGGATAADRFWRFTFTKTAAATIKAYWNGGDDKTILSRTVSFALNRIHLLTADEQLANQGVVTGTIGVDPASLPAGHATMNRQYAEVKGVVEGKGGQYDSLKHLSYALDASSYIGVALADGPVTEESPAVVTFHLNDNQLAPCGYLFANAVNSGTAGAPIDWTVESSTDCVNWTPRDSRTDHSLDRTAGPTTYWEGGEPFLFTASSASWSFSSSRASVASGATLDLSNVPAANVAISGLEVDCAGAGEIKGGVFVANGTLYLKNVPAFDCKIELPITLTDSVSTENFASWTIRVDDEILKDCHIVWRNGRLFVARNLGLFIVVQ